MSKSWLLQCRWTSWCWRVPPTAARHSGTPQDPIQTHPESTDPPCWHGGGCVPKRTPPMEERRNPQWPVLLQRKGSENQVKLNFHESLRPVKNRECKFDHLWPSITIQNPSIAILIPRLSVPHLPVPVQCLIVLRNCKGMGQELLEVIHWEGSTMHDVVVNVDAEKQKW